MSPSFNQQPSVCVIGAGSSGIAAAKALHTSGIAFDCFEKSDRVGGNWVFGNRNGMSSAYRSLHINTSRERMEFSDFPMPRSYPDFPHHSQIAAYFDAYVDHFGFRERIAFETGVEQAARRDDGGWDVTLDNGQTSRYDAIVVANGHHWDPRWPQPPYPGSFDGVQSHAHYYIDNAPFAGRRVLVVGIGNSAMDIAVESSFVAEHTMLSSRRGAHVLPKYLFGRPLDQIGSGRLAGAVPWGIRRRVQSAIYRIGVGRVEDFGLPRPDHRLGESHPTISADFLNRLAHGEMAHKPGIAELTGDGVRFEDGSVEQVDAIVWCTGYNVKFPFFDERLISAPDNDLALFRRVFHPAVDGVFFVGLLQPLGAVMPLAEAQGSWIADYLRGTYALPSTGATARDIEHERRTLHRRYVASPRHTMQVDFDSYLHDLRRERRAGERRARTGAGRRFVPPLAQQAGVPESAPAGS